MGVGVFGGGGHQPHRIIFSPRPIGLAHARRCNVILIGPIMILRFMNICN